MATTNDTQDPQDRAAWEASLEDEFSLSQWESKEESPGGDPAEREEPAGSQAAPAKPDAAPAADAAQAGAEAGAGDAAGAEEDSAAGSDRDGEDDDEGYPDDEAAGADDAPQDPGKPADEPAAPPAEPFKFRADGKEVAPVGAMKVTQPGADGAAQDFIVIPMDTWSREVQPHLADRGAISQREAELRRQVAALDPASNKDALLYTKLATTLHGLVTHSREDWQDKLLDWAAGYRGDAEALAREAEQEAETRRTAAQAEILTPDEEAALAAEWDGRLEKGLRSALTAELEALPQDQRGAVSADEFLKELVEDHGLSLFFRAEEGMKDGAGNPLTPGTIYVNGDLLNRRVSREARNSTRRRAAETAAAEAETRNKQRLGGGRTAAAAAPRRDTPAPPAAGKIDSRAAWEADLDASFGN